MKYKVVKSRERDLLGAFCDEKPVRRRPMTLYNPSLPEEYNKIEFSATSVREYSDGSIKVVCIFYFWLIPVEEEPQSGQT